MLGVNGRTNKKNADGRNAFPHAVTNIVWHCKYCKDIRKELGEQILIQ